MDTKKIKKILIIDLNKEKNSIFKNEFIRPITQILNEEISEKLEIKILHFMEINKFGIENINKFEKIILSGTSLKDFFYLENLDKFLWIKKTSKSILGICAGCQIISKIFDCKLIEEKEIGIFEIINLEKNKLLNLEKGEKFSAYCLHKKSIIDTKNNFKILARSKNINQIIKLKNKNIFGIQFHPEVKNKEIIINFIKL